MYLKGIVKIDKKTKNLVKRLQPGNIAVINHKDIDEVAARSLLETKVAAVINVNESISGAYPNLGPGILIEEIPLLDNVDQTLLEMIKENDEIEIIDDSIFLNGQLLANGDLLDKARIEKKIEDVKQHLPEILERFVDNTLDYAKNEIDLITDDSNIPQCKTVFEGRQTLIVVRGQNYKEDLHAIKSYIRDMKPIIIGVDGGADAILEFGYKPDMIIGDMDSVSDIALKSGAELVVHAYTDGKAPGMERLNHLGLQALVYPSRGTSEDIAMLLAFANKTELIVAVGSHSHMVDFLEKGRKGMASTFLVRLKVGSVLIDAKGVSKIYGQMVKPKYFAWIFIAALVPIFTIILITPSTRNVLNLLLLQLKMFFGGIG